MTAIGLRTHIWNNNLKSLALLAGFPVLVFALWYAGELLAVSYFAVDGGAGLSLAGIHRRALHNAIAAIPYLVIAVAIWFAIAWVFHQRIIDASMNARSVTREEEPRLWNLLENLCISRGLTMPSLRIIETSAMNAYASGLSEKRAAVTVTRGLMDGLDDDELEAVLAHELSHIRNHDVRLLVIAVIFAGIISFVGEVMTRGMFRGSLARAGGSRRGKSGNAGVILLIALAIVALSWVLAIAIRFAMSRRREFMADAGAVELTRNPDAMIGALEKITGRSKVDNAPREVRQMFLDDQSTSFFGAFATHPPIEKRIEALVRYAGGTDVPPPAGLAA
ncbi:MAG: M48 family metallopeptidase [Alphaproteobacteria bacterium]|nr:M48 family metallopeptidase [Alphaproteobacteria bacterium]